MRGLWVAIVGEEPKPKSLPALKAAVSLAAQSNWAYGFRVQALGGSGVFPREPNTP